MAVEGVTCDRQLWAAAHGSATAKLVAEFID
jgi:hypothetical protein